MRQFLSGSQAAFKDLRDRARNACVRFRAQELPKGCIPDRADIGFEVDRQTGRATLYVSKNVAYLGEESSIVAWFSEGRADFSDFESMTAWIQGPLKNAYSEKGDARDLSNVSDQNPSQLTDLTAIRNLLDDTTGDNRPLLQKEIFDRLTTFVRGQDDAVRTFAAVLSRHFARTAPRRPAVLFAVGPTGVGKTRTAEMLPRVLDSLEEDRIDFQFLRLDMSEYQEPYRISQLIGSPQGYMGHGNGSQFVNALVSNPRAIVLFDEIDKAHGGVLRALMNAIDAGRLSTAYQTSNGYEVDCRHAVFVFTSNLAADEIIRELTARDGFGDHKLEDEVCRRQLHNAGMPTEIVGRISQFLVYKGIDVTARAEIVALAIREVAEEYGLHVTYIEPAVIADLVNGHRGDTMGSRIDRHRIDSKLGAIFANGALEHGRAPVLIKGPPFLCVPSDTKTSSGEKDQSVSP